MLPTTLEGPGWSHPSGVPDGTTASWPGPSGNSGRSVTLTLTGLPKYNDPPGLNNGLGDFEIKAGIPDSPCGVIWKFVTVHLFYPEEKTNHPGAGSGTTPNWYYYWDQISFVDYWNIQYDPSRALGHTDWSGTAWVGYVGTENNESYTVPDGPLAQEVLEGVDHFAWACRHEGRHCETSTSWYPNGYQPGLDAADHDWMPDGQESALGGTWQHPLNGGPFIVGAWDTDGDQMRDDEDYTQWTQCPWVEGAADSQDWAHPGHQYPAS